MTSGFLSLALAFALAAGAAASAPGTAPPVAVSPTAAPAAPPQRSGVAAACSAPAAIPGFANWGQPERIGELPPGPFEKRLKEKIVGIHESAWRSPYGELRFVAFRLSGEAAAKSFFERWKTRATREQIVLRRGSCVTVATLAPAAMLRDVTKDLEATERYGPGEAFADLEVSADLFPNSGRLDPRPFELDVSEFEKQEGGTPLAAVRRFMWQRGPAWLEVLFHAPADRGDLQALLAASLKFRGEANGHVVDFVGPGFVAEVIGYAPEAVDELAGRIARAHPGWKRASGQAAAGVGSPTPAAAPR